MHFLKKYIYKKNYLGRSNDILHNCKEVDGKDLAMYVRGAVLHQRLQDQDSMVENIAATLLKTSLELLDGRFGPVKIDDYLVCRVPRLHNYDV